MREQKTEIRTDMHLQRDVFLSEMVLQVSGEGLTLQKTWSRTESYPDRKKDSSLLHITSKINWKKNSKT